MRLVYQVIPFCLLLVGCSLFPQPAGSVAKYILTKPVIQSSVKKIVEKEIFIAQPSLSVALQEHNRIVYYPTSQKIEYLAGGEWAQKLDLMIWESLFEAFKASRKFKLVLSDGSLTEGLTLKTHINLFGVEQDGAKRKVHVVYEFSLFDRENKMISQKRMEQMAELSDIKLDAVVACLNAAHQKVITEYIQGINENC